MKMMQMELVLVLMLMEIFNVGEWIGEYDYDVLACAMPSYI